jgi:UDP-N-acetylmuramate dehydrogenase
VVGHARFAQLQALYPQIPSYAAADGVKIPAAWLVEQCGWKGRRRGAVGVHDQQALVLIHHRDVGGSGRELLALAAAIQADVQARFAVALELEPTVYGAP